MTEWQALGAGFAFYLILEGMLPFFNPDGFKRTLSMLMQAQDSQVRWFGGIMITLGMVLLFSIK